jgi:antitoxin ParD1/3/4
MPAEKLSISILSELMRFIEQYQKEKQLRTKSQVVEEAIQVLRDRELELAYRQAYEQADEA